MGDTAAVCAVTERYKAECTFKASIRGYVSLPQCIIIVCNVNSGLWSSCRFWERPHTASEQRYFNKKMAKKVKKDATSRRLRKYKKRVVESKIVGETA